jgi:hypothetical protein
MSNPYYTNEILFIPRTIIRSEDGNAQFNAIEQAFDNVHDAVLLKAGGSISGNLAIGGTLGVTGVATFTAKPIFSSLTASRPVFSDGSKGLVSVDITGTGSVVLASAPTIENLTYTGTLTGGTGEVNIGGGQFYKSATGAFGFGTTSTLGFRGVFAESAGNPLALLKPTATLTTESIRLRYYSANTNDGGTYDLGGVDYLREDGGFGVRSSMVVTVKRSGGAGGLFEAARFTPAGYFKASNTSTYPGSATSSFHELVNDANTAVVVASSTNTGSAVNVYNSQLPLGSTGFHSQFSTNGVVTHQVFANGNVQNANNSYGAISDLKLKNIIGEKSSTWEKTKAYRWVEYALKSDPDGKKLLGLIAQEAQQISPSVVTSTPDMREVTKTRIVDGKTQDYVDLEPTGENTLAVAYSVISMQYHLTTQECQRRIELLESARLQADEFIQQLRGRIETLEAAV